ncbi:hypothetical protein CEXT_423691 [Caerostris extrusa]|uniref:Uncharacterized protein n=1 Tax=Caerostris extrusa TaxID=172846 RepID=A0AAV4PAT6_CAEEX|nr:hypothetical protein CEXT_423691 [Caerostris extrusa]
MNTEETFNPVIEERLFKKDYFIQEKKLSSVGKPKLQAYSIFCLLILTRKQRLADFAFFGISWKVEIKGLPSEEEIRRGDASVPPGAPADEEE